MNDNELSGAATAAMQSSTSSGERSIFAPFDAFRWTTSAARRKPVGATKHEARNVAWLLSCAPYAQSLEHVHNAAGALVYAAHLQREGPVAEALYRKLARRADELVSFSEVEEALGCRWGEMDVDINGHMQRLDPYFWKMVADFVRDSIVEYVNRLDVTLAQLDGLDAAQLNAGATEAMNRVKRSTAHNLSNALLEKGSGSTRVVQVLARLQAEYQPVQEQFAKRVMREQVRGIRSLGKLIGASLEDFDATLQELETPVLDLFASMPRVLADQFSDRHVSLLELSTIAAPFANGLIGTTSTVPPASMAMRATMIARWVERYRTPVAEACVAAIAVLQRAIEWPSLSAHWSRVELCMADPSDARTRTARHDAVAPWRPPQHIGPELDARLIVTTSRDNTALRIARFFAVLTDQVRLGLLPACKMRASWIIPVVARFTAANAVSHGQYVDMRLRPLADACGVEWPEDASRAPPHPARAPAHVGSKRRAPSPTSSDAESTPSLPAPPAAPEQTAVIVAAAVSNPVGWVHPKLLRDHAVVHALCMCLCPLVGQENIRLPPSAVVERVRSLSGTLRSESAASLTQVVSVVCKRVLQMANEHLGTGGNSYVMEFSSERNRSIGGTVGGVVCHGPGVWYFYKYATWVLQQMRYNSEAYSKVWHATRGAQSRAGHATALLMGSKKHKP